jgi:hypothetical protein
MASQFDLEFVISANTSQLGPRLIPAAKEIRKFTNEGAEGARSLAKTTSASLRSLNTLPGFMARYEKAVDGFVDAQGNAVKAADALADANIKSAQTYKELIEQNIGLQAKYKDYPVIVNQLISIFDSLTEEMRETTGAGYGLDGSFKVVGSAERLLRKEGILTADVIADQEAKFDRMRAAAQGNAETLLQVENKYKTWRETLENSVQASDRLVEAGLRTEASFLKQIQKLQKLKDEANSDLVAKKDLARQASVLRRQIDALTKSDTAYYAAVDRIVAKHGEASATTKSLVAALDAERNALLKLRAELQGIETAESNAAAAHIRTREEITKEREEMQALAIEGLRVGDSIQTANAIKRIEELNNEVLEADFRFQKFIGTLRETGEVAEDVDFSTLSPDQLASGIQGSIQAQQKFSKQLKTSNYALQNFSFIIQDSAQFMSGGKFSFAQGLRAIANNLDATLFSLIQVTTAIDMQQRAIGNMLTQQELWRLAWKQIGASMASPIGILVGINILTTSIQLLTQLFGGAEKEANKLFQSLNAISSVVEKPLTVELASVENLEVMAHQAEALEDRFDRLLIAAYKWREGSRALAGEAGPDVDFFGAATWEDMFANHAEAKRAIEDYEDLADTFQTFSEKYREQLAEEEKARRVKELMIGSLGVERRTRLQVSAALQKETDKYEELGEKLLFLRSASAPMVARVQEETRQRELLVETLGAENLLKTDKEGLGVQQEIERSLLQQTGHAEKRKELAEEEIALRKLSGVSLDQAARQGLLDDEREVLELRLSIAAKESTQFSTQAGALKQQLEVTEARRAAVEAEARTIGDQKKIEFYEIQKQASESTIRAMARMELMRDFPSLFRREGEREQAIELVEKQEALAKLQGRLDAPQRAADLAATEAGIELAELQLKVIALRTKQDFVQEIALEQLRADNLDKMNQAFAIVSTAGTSEETTAFAADTELRVASALKEQRRTRWDLIAQLRISAAELGQIESSEGQLIFALEQQNELFKKRIDLARARGISNEDAAARGALDDEIELENLRIQTAKIESTAFSQRAGLAQQEYSVAQARRQAVEQEGKTLGNAKLIQFYDLVRETSSLTLEAMAKMELLRDFPGLFRRAGEAEQAGGIVDAETELVKLQAQVDNERQVRRNEGIQRETELVQLQKEIIELDERKKYGPRVALAKLQRDNLERENKIIQLRAVAGTLEEQKQFELEAEERVLVFKAQQREEVTALGAELEIQQLTLRRMNSQERRRVLALQDAIGILQHQIALKKLEEETYTRIGVDAFEALEILQEQNRIQFDLLDISKTRYFTEEGIATTLAEQNMLAKAEKETAAALLELEERRAQTVGDRVGLVGSDLDFAEQELRERRQDRQALFGGQPLISDTGMQNYFDMLAGAPPSQRAQPTAGRSMRPPAAMQREGMTAFAGLSDEELANLDAGLTKTANMVTLHQIDNQELLNRHITLIRQTEAEDRINEKIERRIRILAGVASMDDLLLEQGIDMEKQMAKTALLSEEVARDREREASLPKTALQSRAEVMGQQLNDLRDLEMGWAEYFLTTNEGLEHFGAISSATFGAFADAATMAFEISGKQNEKWFAVQKGFQVAQAIADTYVAANKALAQGGIFGIPMAAAVIAAGMVNVWKIIRTKPGDSPDSSTGGQMSGSPGRFMDPTALGEYAVDERRQGQTGVFIVNDEGDRLWTGSVAATGPVEATGQVMSTGLVESNGLVSTYGRISATGPIEAAGELMLPMPVYEGTLELPQLQAGPLPIPEVQYPDPPQTRVQLDISVTVDSRTEGRDLVGTIKNEVRSQVERGILDPLGLRG